MFATSPHTSRPPSPVLEGVPREAISPASTIEEALQNLSRQGKQDELSNMRLTGTDLGKQHTVETLPENLHTPGTLEQGEAPLVAERASLSRGKKNGRRVPEKSRKATSEETQPESAHTSAPVDESVSLFNGPSTLRRWSANGRRVAKEPKSDAGREEGVDTVAKPEVVKSTPPSRPLPDPPAAA